MSAPQQRGRRRAESTRRPSLFGLASASNGTRAASKSSPVAATAKCMAAVAVLGALVAAGSVAQSVENTLSDQGNTSLVSAVDRSVPAPAVSVPTDAAISFPGIAVSSSPKAAATPAAVKAEAEQVKAVTAAPAPVAVDDPAAAKAYASGQMAAHGWGADQMSCLTLLWQRESEWLTSAENASSGAYGIAQSLPANKMDSEGSDWSTNFQTQIRWGLSYIEGRYGSPCGAWGHSESVGWY
ncbi:transglycosylase [Arthrobacter glacialis]|uniref:Transglycosylase n=1 Tax=Arthrobacter glacialis TaxID=1664 RepID=A0A2S4A229_ARTGL|nr:transglycosylase [Arthrobacter glacialis]POH75379.1 transglycosylase [Arthrobacter glacialis]